MTNNPTYAHVPCHHAKGTAVTINANGSYDFLQLSLGYAGLAMQSSMFISIEDAEAVHAALGRVLAARQAIIDATNQLQLPEAA